MKPEFREEQRFTQWWVRVPLIGIGLIPAIGLYQQLILGVPFGDNPASDLGLIIISLIIFGIMALFRLIRLTTEIDQYEIRFSLYPFVRKKIFWRDVKSAEVIKYGFVGGWGIRFGTKYGTVYIIRGNRGLALKLLNGTKLLIGTQKETELSQAVAKILETSH